MAKHALLAARAAATDEHRRLLQSAKQHGMQNIWKALNLTVPLLILYYLYTSPGTYVTKTQILLHHGNSALTPAELAIKALTGDHYLPLTNF